MFFEDSKKQKKTMSSFFAESVEDTSDEMLDEEFEDLDDEDSELDECGDADLAESVQPTFEGDQLILAMMVSEGMADEAMLSEERNIVKLNKYAKRSRIESQSAMVLAKEANDPLYKKLKILNAKRMELKRDIARKYGSRAKQRALQVERQASKAKQISKKSVDLPSRNPNSRSM